MIERPTESVPVDDSSADILATWPEGRVVGERYEIGPVLGTGGSSVIYRAFDRTLGQAVALKVLRRDRISPAAIARLKREVAVARNAISPRLVRVFDIGTTDEDTFITMELIDGESLRTRLQRGRLSVAETLSIAQQLLEGLAVLHARNIVHRDVKPSNVLVDASGAIKLADFGLAVDPASDGERPTQTGTLVGTAEYMSPEQVVGSPLDARSDLYSFGVLLYECLTGDLPFSGRSSIGAMLAHVRERPRSIRQLRPEVPAWLSRFVGNLLRKDRELRIASAGEALQMLQSERAPREWRRFAAGAAAAALLVITAVVFFGVSFERPKAVRLRAHNGNRVGAGSGGVDILDADGHVLWTRLTAHVGYTALVHLKDGTRYVVAVDGADKKLPPERRYMRFFDADSGKLVFAVPSWSPAGIAFGEFPNRFSALRLFTADFDHDGNDEVVTTWIHDYWPSYTVVFDVSQRLERVVFLHSGHESQASVADLNGDGRDDLILAGVNNKMGWYANLAAIDVPPPSRAITPLTVSSPDAVYSSSREQLLLFYLLLPPQYPLGDAIKVNSGAREILLSTAVGPPIRITFDGFLVGEKSPLDVAGRRMARASAFDKLRRAERMIAAEEFASASDLASAAIDSAVAAGDPHLADWARRVHLRTLIQLGQLSRAEAIANALFNRRSAADVAWDAAYTLHLTGHLDDAVRWYRKGLYAGLDWSGGRLRYEFVQGAVLALGEQKRWAEGEAFIEESRPMIASFSSGPAYINYLRWRRGEKSFLPAPPTSVADLELERYWALERSHVTGVRGATLLEKVRNEEKQNQFVGLLRSLEAVALAEAGQPNEARQTAEDALEWCSIHAKSDTAVRAHLDIVRERAKKYL